MKFEIIPQGVCPTKLQFELDGNIVRNVQFLGGCDGNLQAISKLVDGLTVDQIQSKLMGIHCGFKDTSCSDQLARAIVIAAKQQKEQLSHTHSEPSK